MDFRFRKPGKKSHRKTPRLHLLRILSRERARQVYLVLAHLTVIVGLLFVGQDAGTLLFSFLCFLLAFRFFRRYFSLSRDIATASYPGGFFFLSHLIFLYSFMLARTSTVEDACFLPFLVAVVVLAIYRRKARDVKTLQALSVLRESTSVAMPRATTLPELLRDEYFVERAMSVKLNIRKHRHLTVTNLRLLFLDPRTLELHEVPLSDLSGLKVFPERWYLKLPVVLILLLDLLLILILMAWIPPLALLLFLLSLFLVVRYLWLTNVLMLRTPWGEICLSGETFNPYYMRDLLGSLIKECFGYHLHLPSPLEPSSRPGRDLKRFLPTALLVSKPGERLFSMFLKPETRLPSQPRVSFGLANYGESLSMKRKKKRSRRLFRLSYLMLFIGIFFYHPMLIPYILVELFIASLLLWVAWNYWERTKQHEEELGRLRTFGQSSWEEARGTGERVKEGGEGGVRKHDKTRAEATAGWSRKTIGNPGKQEWWKGRRVAVEFVLLGLGWLTIIVSLLLAKMVNDGSLYIDGLFIGVTLLALYRFLKLRREKEEENHYLSHEHTIITTFFPGQVDERNISRMFTLFISGMRRLGSWSEAFTTRLAKLAGLLFSGEQKSGTRSSSPENEDESHHGKGLRAIYTERGFSSFFHQHKAYLTLGVVFTITILILAITRPAFGVRDARIADDDLLSSENPGWHLESSETAIDFMKVLYVSVRFYQDEAEDEGYPAMLVLVSLKVPLVKLSAKTMVDRMREELEDRSRDENVIIEKEVENGMRRNAEGREVYYYVYNGTSGDETTFFTKGKTTKNLGAVWRSERNSLHIAIGFAQVSNLSLNNTDIVDDPPVPDPIPIPNPLNTTDETNWNELFGLVFKVETYRPG